MHICSHDIGSNLFSKRQFWILLQAPQIMVDWWNENVFTYLPKISFTWHGYSHYALCFKWYLFVGEMKSANQNFEAEQQRKIIWCRAILFAADKLFDAEQFYLQQRNLIWCRAILFAAEKLYSMQSDIICRKCTLSDAAQFYLMQRNIIRSRKLYLFFRPSGSRYIRAHCKINMRRTVTHTSPQYFKIL